SAQTLETFREATLDRAAQVAHVVALDPDLGGDLRPRRQRTDVAPDRLFGSAVAIERGGVDPVDAGLDGTGQRRDTSRILAPAQDSASIATTESNFRDFEAATAEQGLSHTLSLSRSRDYASCPTLNYHGPIVTLSATRPATGSVGSCRWPSSAGRCETRSSADTCRARAWLCNDPAAPAPCHHRRGPEI